MALGKPPQPPATQENPYLPSGLPRTQFATNRSCRRCRMDTGRTGVPDENTYWMDGVMPYAPKRARSMYGIGSLLFTASGALTIVFYRFVTLTAFPNGLVHRRHHPDGSILRSRTDTGAVTTVAPAGTILSPSQLNCDINQWGNLYVLIVATQTNGYWVWNGMTLFAAGTLGPVITITNAGAGYSTPPSVIISGGHGSGASAVAAIANGFVTGATITSAGSGWLAGDTPSITFVGGTSAGSGGSVTAILGHNAGGSGGSLTVPSLTSAGGKGFELTTVVVAPTTSAPVTAQTPAAAVSGLATAVSNAVLSTPRSLVARSRRSRSCRAASTARRPLSPRSPSATQAITSSQACRSSPRVAATARTPASRAPVAARSSPHRRLTLR